MKLSALDIVSLVLVIIGGLNWLLVGLFGYDLVANILGSMSSLSRIVYILVGLAAILLAVTLPKLEKKG
jgi:uncharacterized membrane protein YuzA (DUF378 family)